MKKRIALLALSLGLATTLLASSTVFAHVTVKPNEVLTASFQTYTMSVPSEKDQPTTSLKLLIPSGLKHVTPSVKSGWDITVEKQGEGEAATVTAIVWENGSVPAGFRDDFTFSAQAPAKTGELQWKAYQTYEDGQTVAWDVAADKQPKKADGSPDFSASGPFSVTKVTDKTTSGAHDDKVSASTHTADTDKANAAAKRALYFGATGIVLGLVGIFLATRKPQKS